MECSFYTLFSLVCFLHVLFWVKLAREKKSEILSSIQVYRNYLAENVKVDYFQNGGNLSTQQNHTETHKHGMAQRGKYWVYYNFMEGSKNFQPNESVTYATHSDFTYLDNLIPLAERWRGPISISVYCPGIDYYETFKRIQYFRECTQTPQIKQLVTFHLFFDSDCVLLPQKILMSRNNSEFDSGSRFNCSSVDFGKSVNETFKKQRKLTYPVNVARNIAREMAQTFYVLVSDIELWPSPNLIPKFLQLVQRNDVLALKTPNPRVFVLPIFELEGNVTKLPEDKTELIQMLQNKSAVLFHKFVCSYCQRFPGYDEWIKVKNGAEIKDQLNIFQSGKRQDKFKHWEPIFIGTKQDPVYDERLSWEGLKDKMTQGYALCVLDYDFLILDNAFLIHRPGVKRIPNDHKGLSQEIKTIRKKQNAQITYKVVPELQKLYGKRAGCDV